MVSVGTNRVCLVILPRQPAESRKYNTYLSSLTVLAMKSRSHADFNYNKMYENKYYGFMNKSVKTLVCVFIVSYLMLAT